MLKAPKDWVDALDQWRETRGNVLHLGKPSRPASIRYLVRVGMAAERKEAKPRTNEGRAGTIKGTRGPGMTRDDKLQSLLKVGSIDAPISPWGQLPRNWAGNLLI